MRIPSRAALVTLLAAAPLWGCASTKSTTGQDSDVLTREEIMGVRATNLFDVVNRLRPRWLQVRTVSSFNLSDEIVVFQNDMNLGGPDALRQLQPDVAYEIRWLDGIRASSTLPGLMSGRHIQGAIVISTRPPGGN
jgi:hypothetical protein